MAQTKPDRRGAKYVKDFDKGQGRGEGLPGQNGKPVRQNGAVANAMKGNSMAQPNNDPHDAPAEAAAEHTANAGYKRAHAGVSPTTLPFKRQKSASK